MTELETEREDFQNIFAGREQTQELTEQRKYYTISSYFEFFQENVPFFFFFFNLENI